MTKRTNPIAIVTRQTGKSHLQVLEEVKAALLERHAEELARKPKVRENLDAMIEKAKRDG